MKILEKLKNRDPVLLFVCVVLGAILVLLLYKQLSPCLRCYATKMSRMLNVELQRSLNQNLSAYQHRLSLSEEPLPIATFYPGGDLSYLDLGGDHGYGRYLVFSKGYVPVGGSLQGHRHLHGPLLHTLNTQRELFQQCTIFSPYVTEHAQACNAIWNILMEESDIRAALFPEKADYLLVPLNAQVPGGRKSLPGTCVWIMDHHSKPTFGIEYDALHGTFNAFEY